MQSGGDAKDESWLSDDSNPMQEEETRRKQELRDEIFRRLSEIIDPDLGKNLVELNFIKEFKLQPKLKKLSFTIELTTMACPVKDVFVRQAQDLLEDLELEVTINLDARPSEVDAEYAGHANAGKNLLKVSNIVAISSGKGGVGKSTVGVNIAYMLSSMGAKVGIVDCDVYGPSLPALLPIESPQVYFRNTYDEVKDAIADEVKRGADEKELDARQAALQSGEGAMLPLTYRGVKVMSYGYLRPGANKYAAVRGPIASSLIYQMITQTEWGHLDYLFLDLPPGTGDIHLTLGQTVPVTGAIIITTNHPLSLSDVEKGLHMFSNMRIPPVAIIENMSYIACPKCGEEIDINTHECAEVTPLLKLKDMFGIKLLTKLPMDREFARVQWTNGEKGIKRVVRAPFVQFAAKDNLVYKRLEEFCRELIMELAKFRYAGNATPEVQQIDTGMVRVTFPGKLDAPDRTYHVSPRDIRLRCRCAECVDEFSGRVRINSRMVKKNLLCESIKKMGNYAVNIKFDDSHSSIIAFSLMENIAKEAEVSGVSATGNCDHITVGW